MISLSEATTIPFPREVVWRLLLDPALVATCIPGASLSASPVPGVYQGEVRVKFGPTWATLRGEAKITYDIEHRNCTVEGRGANAGDPSRATAAGVVSVSGTDETLIKVEGSFDMAGPLAVVANAVGAEVARKLLAEFSRNMTRLLASEGAPAPEAESIPLVEPQTVAQQARAAAIQSAAAPTTDAVGARGGAAANRIAGWLRGVLNRKAGI